MRKGGYYYWWNTYPKTRIEGNISSCVQYVSYSWDSTINCLPIVFNKLILINEIQFLTNEFKISRNKKFTSEGDV